MKIDDFLSESTRLGFDTAPIIYFVEANPIYDEIVTAIFQQIDSGSVLGFTSVISLCEVLVQPIRNGNKILQALYAEILIESPNFLTLDINPQIAKMAASLRAQYNLRTPDALQLATAIENDCSAFLCNDKQLKRVGEINVTVLSELTI